MKECLKESFKIFENIANLFNFKLKHWWYIPIKFILSIIFVIPLTVVYFIVSLILFISNVCEKSNNRIAEIVGLIILIPFMIIIPLMLVVGLIQLLICAFDIEETIENDDESPEKVQIKPIKTVKVFMKYFE